MAKYNKNALKLSKKLDALIVDKFLNPLGNRLNKRIQDGLRDGKDIHDKPFEPLSDFTIQKKGHDKILVDSGTLKDSVRKKPATHNNPVVQLSVQGRARKYADKHLQKGGFISDTGNQVPQREWFGMPKTIKPNGEEHKKLLNELKMRIKLMWNRGS